MKRLLVAPIVLAIVAMAGIARADDSATGTWKWTVMAGGNSRDVTLKLKQDGDKLTGTISGRNNDTEITDGSVKDGTVTFSVVRERNGNKITTKYSGKLSGDTIKGTTEFERNGQTQSRDWEAKREKA
jgi:hypothetical protein